MKVARIVAALALGAASVAAATPALASTPSDSGTLTPPADPGSVSASWTGTIAGANANSDCSQSADPSLNDHHTFTLSVPAGFYDTHTVKLAVTSTADAADAILTVYRDGTLQKSSDTGSVGGSETYAITNPPSGQYDAVTCSFAGASPYNASVTLTTSLPDTAGPTGGTSTTAGPSTYGNYTINKPGADQSGEPSIGVDWNTGNVYFQANLNTFKAVFPSYGAQPTFTDVSCALTTVNTLDPIAYTDSTTGRTGVSQLLANPLAFNSETQFFSGDPTGPQTVCTQSNGGGQVAGPDHQSLGGGTYPKPTPAGVVPAADGRAFYYCSQDVAAGAVCARSDTGGAVFTNTGTPPYTTECGGLHGHVRVGPEGTVYLPNKSCGQTQGVAVSKDAGQTWTVQPVTGSTPGATDPSVSADRAGNVFFGYIGGDGRPAISVSPDQGATWSKPVFVGDAFNIQNSVFSEVIAGDAGRAAFAFLGTPTPGNRNALDFAKNGDVYNGGEFHLYIATTIDGGQTYKTIDATPTDPVQRGAICTDGTTCMGGTRNLLDFNDITVDKTGHVVIAYADGCTGACVTSNKIADNPHSSQGVIARQIDGPLLFAANDTAAPSPVVPEAPVAVLLPIAALGIAGGLVLRRRRAAGALG